MGDQATSETSFEWPLSSIEVGFHVPRSRMCTPDENGIAIDEPVGCHATRSRCAEPGATLVVTRMVLMAAGSSVTSQHLMVPSAEEEAKNSPFGSKATHSTESERPSGSRTALPRS